MNLNPELGMQAANLVISSILTASLVYLYKKQSDTMADQTEIADKQTQIMQNQNILKDLQQEPEIEILSWSIDENDISILISNIGGGVASKLGIQINFRLSSPEDPDDARRPQFMGYRWSGCGYNVDVTRLERTDWETNGVKRSIRPGETNVEFAANLLGMRGLGDTGWPTDSGQEFSKRTFKKRIGYEIQLKYDTPSNQFRYVSLYRASIPIKDQTTFEDLLLVIEGGMFEAADPGVPGPDNQVLPK